jgi:hypothetical protein
MNNKEKRAIAKLVKIAKNQQKIIHKLAQDMTGNISTQLSAPASPPQQDPNVEYLMRAIPTAAANAGINNVVVIKVDKQPSATTNFGAVMDDTYTTQVRGIPNKQRNIFKQVWDKQVSIQKPDLVGKVSFFYED